MNNSNTGPGTANPLFVGSIPTRASIHLDGYSHASHKKSHEENSCLHEIKLHYTRNFMTLPVSLRIDERKKVSIRFTHDEKRYIIPLNCSISDISEQEVFSFVEKKIREAKNVKEISCVFDEYIANDDFGGSLDHRKKCVQGGRWFFRESDISLEETTKFLLNTDDEGFTLPEQWEVYGKPHKLRQFLSLFSKKNLKVWKRLGYNVSHFANFVSYVAESPPTTPFSTSDKEVNHIIEYFNNARLEHPVFYDIYLLAFGCGLRQSEIYQVRYEDFITFNNQHFLQLPFATKRSKLKGLSTHSEKVPVSQQVYEHFTQRSSRGRIVCGAKRLHKRFVRFLKEEVGITENKACHRLRKILGARLATEHGIYHASKQLRNSVSVCEKYYSDLTSHRNELQV